MEPFQVTEQYKYIRESRHVLFDHCKTISGRNFLKEHSSFGNGGSIRNLLVHVANAYESWIANKALKKSIAFTAFDAIQDIPDLIGLYDQVDYFMYEFMNLPLKSMSIEIQGVDQSIASLKLFSHVVTHEFHHKGQVLALSRQYGYIPVDTDILR